MNLAALISLINQNNTEIIEILENALENRLFDINVSDFNGNTLLHHAVSDNRVQIAILLIQKGANINAQNNDGDTPLHLTSLFFDDVQMVNILIENGAIINSVNQSDFTPLHFASRSGNIDVANLLIQNGANVIAVNRENSTPLHLASLSGSNDVVELLLDIDEVINNIDSQDIRGCTSLINASMNSHFRVIDLLLNKGYANPYIRNFI